MSDYFPSEILIEILLRLPVKSVIRFRCVSKSWNSLLTNADFISMHTKHTINDQNSTSKLLVRFYSSTEKREKYAIHCDDSEFSVYWKIDSPLFRVHEFCFYIVGSSNGLVCLSTGFHSIILWNPAIEKYLPYLIPNRDGVCIDGLVHVVLGFGFVCKSDDYKVVKFGYYLSHDVGTLVSYGVEIFELKTSVWRRIKAMPPPCRNSNGWPQAFVNGVVHWAAERGIESSIYKLIVTFDMSEEMFGEMELPDGIDGEINGNLLVFDESLCYVYNDRRDGWTSCCIWVMKEYGVKASWTKFIIDLEGQVRYTLGFRKSGEIIQVTGGGELVSYDSLSHRVTSLGIMGSRYTMHVDPYVETLALLDKQVNWNMDGHVN